MPRGMMKAQALRLLALQHFSGVQLFQDCQLHLVFLKVVQRCVLDAVADSGQTPDLAFVKYCAAIGLHLQRLPQEDHGVLSPVLLFGHELRRLDNSAHAGRGGLIVYFVFVGELIAVAGDGYVFVGCALHHRFPLLGCGLSAMVMLPVLLMRAMSHTVTVSSRSPVLRCGLVSPASRP